MQQTVGEWADFECLSHVKILWTSFTFWFYTYQLALSSRVGSFTQHKVLLGSFL